MYKLILVFILFIFNVLASPFINNLTVDTVCGFYTDTLPPSSTTPCPTFDYVTKTIINNINPTYFPTVSSKHKKNVYKKTII